MTPYFDLPRPRVLAHRGLATAAPENTLAAFAAAVAVGAAYLETDVQASADRVAVLSHDPDLARVAGRPERIRDLTAAQLAAVDLGGGNGYASLAEALEALPASRFNIDVKDPAAVGPAAEAILAADAVDRVLITSFDEGRRRATVDRLTGVATSASARRLVPALLAAKLGVVPVVRAALRGIDAVQMPERGLGMTTTTPRVIRTLHAAGVEVHIWTVNDPARMAALLELGVDGIITDRADLGILTVNRYILSDNPL